LPTLRGGEGRNSRVPPGDKQLVGKAHNRGSYPPYGVPMGFSPLIPIPNEIESPGYDRDQGMDEDDELEA